MSKLTRRQFLEGAAALTTIPLNELSFPLDDPGRVATIQAYIAHFDKLSSPIQQARQFLVNSLSLPQSEVNGARWMELEAQVVNTTGAFAEGPAMMDTDELFKALTGKSVLYWIVRGFIVTKKMPRDFCLGEIAAMWRDGLGKEAAELQALLDARGY